MSFANFGIGIGALAQGLTQGMQLGTQLKGAMNQHQIQKAHKDGMANAKTARQSAIDDLVKVGGMSNASNTMTVPAYEVQGQTFGDQDSARKAAEDQVGSVTDFFYKNEAPKIADLYMEQGDLEKAETWQKWIKDKNVQKGFEYGVRAYQAATLGDDESAVKSLIKMYNHPGYFEDGKTATGYQPIKADDGSVSGYAITVKDKQGNENVLNVEKGEGLLRAITPFIDPQTTYEMGWSEISAARDARLKMALDDRKHSQALQLQGVKDDGALERVITKGELANVGGGSAVNQKVTLLKQNGYSEDWIAQNLPAILGIGEYKKAIPPEDVKLRLHEGRIKNDYEYSRLSRPEQMRVIEQDMQMIYGDQSAPKANPMSGGLGTPAPSAAGGAMIYDTRTGQMVPHAR